MANSKESLNNKTLAVVGLGYVGLPLAVEFAKIMDVIGYDIDSDKVDLCRLGIDPADQLENFDDAGILFSYNPEDLQKAQFIIVAVPTPVRNDKTPDLDLIISAASTVGQNLSQDAVVVFESTVYPGVTENVLIPILEEESGLRCCIDFKVGYSPERINPGDSVHTLRNITKIVAGIDESSGRIIADLYSLIIKAGVHRVSDIRTAEAVKVIENSQRDINIAFINEVAMIFHEMGIDTNEVIDAMDTKWNALGFRPGLVGGHCIAVDPYYFIYETEKLGFNNQLISAGRRINDGMADYLTSVIMRKMVETDKCRSTFRIAILGITYKEDCKDLRNSKVVEIVKLLNKHGIETVVVDPVADKERIADECGIEITEIEDVRDVDCIVLAVAHKAFRSMPLQSIDCLYREMPSEEKILIDIKGMWTREELEAAGYNYWRL